MKDTRYLHITADMYSVVKFGQGIVLNLDKAGLYQATATDLKQAILTYLAQAKNCEMACICQHLADFENALPDQEREVFGHHIDCVLGWASYD